jgi:nucleoid-associated protein YgaU
MGNIEKYGVLALIFVIVLILAVAICNGPGDAAKPPGGDVKLGGAPPASEIDLRPNVRKALEDQDQKEGKVGPSVVHGGEAGPANGGVAVDKNPQFKTYVVQKDDTLETIAKAELGARSRWPEIVKANEGLDPKKLKINQSLLIPVTAGGDALALADDKSAIKPAKKSTKSTGTKSSK